MKSIQQWLRILLSGSAAVVISVFCLQTAIISVSGATSTSTTAPTITSVSPTSGLTYGVETISIFGTHLTNTESVIIDNYSAKWIFKISSTQIGIELDHSPTPGTYSVTVNTPYGSATLTTAFTFIKPPKITSITPNHGPTSGGTLATIHGSSFLTPTTGVPIVKSVVFSNYTAVVTGRPIHSPLKLNTTTPSTVPTLTTPKNSPVQQPFTDSSPASTIHVLSTTTLTLVTPAHDPLDALIYVTTSVGTTSLSNAFQYEIVPPEISSLNPGVGLTAGGTSVTIKGSNFTTVTAVLFGTNPALSFTVTSPIAITAKTPQHAPGEVSVSVIAKGGTARDTTGFQFVQPIQVCPSWGCNGYPWGTPPVLPPVPGVTSVNPSVGSVTGGTSVTIDGANFTSVTAIYFGTAIAESFKVTSSSVITLIVPQHSPGEVEVTISSKTGTAIATTAFTFVPSPTIKSIKKRSGSIHGGTKVTITGNFFTHVDSIKFGRRPVESFKVVNSQKIIVTTPSHRAKKVLVSITTEFGRCTKTKAFSYVEVAP